MLCLRFLGSFCFISYFKLAIIRIVLLLLLVVVVAVIILITIIMIKLVIQEDEEEDIVVVSTFTIKEVLSITIWLLLIPRFKLRGLGTISISLKK